MYENPLNLRNWLLWQQRFNYQFYDDDRQLGFYVFPDVKQTMPINMSEQRESDTFLFIPLNPQVLNLHSSMETSSITTFTIAELIQKIFTELWADLNAKKPGIYYWLQWLYRTKYVKIDLRKGKHLIIRLLMRFMINQIQQNKPKSVISFRHRIFPLSSLSSHTKLEDVKTDCGVFT